VISDRLIRRRRSRHVRFAPESGHVGRGLAKSALCHNVWPGRAVQDGFPRATNVRAASMYQVSLWSIFSGPSWGSPRIPAGWRQDLEGPFWHPVSWLRRADRPSISSFHLADLGGEAIDIDVLSRRLSFDFDVGGIR